MNILLGKIKKNVIGLILIITGIVLIGAPGQTYAQETGIETKLIRSEKLANMPGKTLFVAEINYAPGAKLSRGDNPGSVLVMVLSGAISSKNSATEAAKIYKAGESFFELPGSPSIICDNASTTEPARMLAIFVADDAAGIKTLSDTPKPPDSSETTP